MQENGQTGHPTLRLRADSPQGSRRTHHLCSSRGLQPQRAGRWQNACDSILVRGLVRPACPLSRGNPDSVREGYFLPPDRYSLPSSKCQPTGRHPPWLRGGKGTQDVSGHGCASRASDGSSVSTGCRGHADRGSPTGFLPPSNRGLGCQLGSIPQGRSGEAQSKL